MREGKKVRCARCEKEEGEDVGGAAALNDRGSASGSSPSTLFLSRVEAMMGSRKTRAFGAVEKRSLRTC